MRVIASALPFEILVERCPMPLHFFPVPDRPPQALTIWSPDMNLTTVIVELVFFLLMVVAFFLFRPRMMKILCGFLAEVCLWLACRMAFGKEFILSEIMNWVTAIAVLGLMIAIVNRIDWGSLRGDNKKK